MLGSEEGAILLPNPKSSAAPGNGSKLIPFVISENGPPVGDLGYGVISPLSVPIIEGGMSTPGVVGSVFVEPSGCSNPVRLSGPVNVIFNGCGQSIVPIAPNPVISAVPSAVIPRVGILCPVVLGNGVCAAICILAILLFSIVTSRSNS